MFPLWIIAALLIGHAFWYVYFGVECTINGAMRGGLNRPYLYAWEDFQRLCGVIVDREWHPSWSLFLIPPTLIHGIPVVVVLVLNSMGVLP